MVEVESNELREAVLHLREYERILLVVGETRKANLVRGSIEDLGDVLARERVRTYARNGARKLEKRP